MRVCAILAETPKHGIGKNGRLPWHLPKELEHFWKTVLPKKEGERTCLIMGMKTWESLPQKARNVPDVLYIVLSRTRQNFSGKDNVLWQEGLQQAFQTCEKSDLLKSVFVIGGARLFNEANANEFVREFIITHIKHEYPSDVFWRGLNMKEWVKASEEDHSEFSFAHYVRRGFEWDYHQLVRKILEHGEERNERTGVGTLSLFGEQLKVNLAKGFPLVTTKKTPFKSIVEELLWFIRGETSTKTLDCHIWDANASREFLDARGLGHYPEGVLGPIYGFQWRHFGALYEGADANYEGKGVDQLRQVIRQIRENPTSRRIVMSAWNAADLNKMALPPCHVLCQFFVSVERQTLSCHMYQRSADVGLGVPFNVASYALLTHLIARATNLNVGELIISFGDVHVYKNHVQELKEVLLKRVGFQLPMLQLRAEVKEVEDFKSEDIHLLNYVAHPAIKLKMAI